MRRRGWIVAAVVVALLAGAATVAYEPLLRHLVVTRAREGGVELSSIEELSLGLGRVVLEGVSFRLAGVEGLEGQAAHLELELDGLAPTKIIARDMKLSLTGSAIDLILALGVWTEAHPELWRLPTEAEDVQLEWRAVAGAEPWLVAKGAEMTPTRRGAKLTAKRAQLLGVGVGRLGAVWDGSGAEASFGFGKDDLDEAPLRAVIQHEAAPPKLALTLAPTPLSDLAGPLAMLLPMVGDVVVGGRSDLLIQADGGLAGTVETKVVGFSPPVPRELSGFVFGDTTRLRADLVIDAAYDDVELSEILVTHGAMKLAGHGTIDRRGHDAVIDLILKGRLGCADLAAAATRSHLEGEVGKILGTLAGKALKGSVGLSLEIHADTQNLLATRVARRIGVGCGLELLGPEDLPPLPDVLDFEKMPKLPKIPGLPQLPEL